MARAAFFFFKGRLLEISGKVKIHGFQDVTVTYWFLCLKDAVSLLNLVKQLPGLSVASAALAE